MTVISPLLAPKPSKQRFLHKLHALSEFPCGGNFGFCAPAGESAFGTHKKQENRFGWVNTQCFCVSARTRSPWVVGGGGSGFVLKWWSSAAALHQSKTGFVKRLGRQTTGCTCALRRLLPLHFLGALMKIDAASAFLHQQIWFLSKNEVLVCVDLAWQNANWFQSQHGYKGE